jgi:hypothetical protein
MLSILMMGMEVSLNDLQRLHDRQLLGGEVGGLGGKFCQLVLYCFLQLTGV